MLHLRSQWRFAALQHAFCTIFQHVGATAFMVR
jgi:hypothetical protein